MARGSPSSLLICSSSSSTRINGRRRISLYHPSLLPLQSCRTLRQLLQAQAHLVVTGIFSTDPFAASRVLKSAADLAGAAGAVAHADVVFRHVHPAPDAFCVNTVIKAHSRSDNPRGAVTFFFQAMGSGRPTNSFTFPPLMNACARIPSLDDGEKCHGQAVKNGVDSVIHVQNALVNMYASCGAADCARMLFDRMRQRDLVSWNSMVDGYVKSADLVSARVLFDRMPERNVVSWNAMISGYVKGRNPECGLELFREMRMAGLQGSVTTLVSIAAACARLGKLNEGRSVHGVFLRSFPEANLILETALVDMYSKCRRVEVARKVFEGMSGRNLVCWNAMILGHCIHGCPEDGLALFEDMVGRGSQGDATNYSSLVEGNGVSPDEVTFVGLLCACTRAGLLSQGKAYFNQMASKYNITPSFAHYWCMANLFGSVGLIEEAEEVLRGMPEETESLVWSGLLWLCRIHGDIELGERIATQLIELEPYNSSRYALLWNVYAAAGRWEDVGKLEETMRERGVSRIPGRTLVDLNKVVHNFKVGDRSKDEMVGVYTMMDELAERLKLQKHLPDSMETG